MLHRENLRLLASAVLLALLAPLPAHAATWVLANGDRLTGTLVRETDAEIEIQHAQLGAVKLPRRALAPTPATESAPPAMTPSAASATPPRSAARTGPRWTRQIEVGYATQDGAKTKRDFNARFQIEGHDARSNSYRATMSLLRAEAQQVVTLDRKEADFRWRHDFSKRLFTQTLTTFTSDDLKQINYSFEQQLGAGYRLFDAERQKVNIGLGAVLQRLSREGYEDYNTTLASAFQDYAVQWTDRLKFTQEATLFVGDDPNVAVRGSRTTFAGPPGEGNYRVKLNAALQTRMTDRMSFNLRYELDYDHSVPDPNFRSDSRLTSSLGYAW